MPKEAFSDPQCAGSHARARARTHTHTCTHVRTRTHARTHAKVVDDNVTRHVMPELENEDWDVMILHYLGLDHAGHLGSLNDMPKA